MLRHRGDEESEQLDCQEQIPIGVIPTVGFQVSVTIQQHLIQSFIISGIREEQQSINGIRVPLHRCILNTLLFIIPPLLLPKISQVVTRMVIPMFPGTKMTKGIWMVI